MKNLKFYLLGKCDQSNPSSIPLNQIKSWENEGLITYLGESPDVRPIIEKSSCIILPSYREGIAHLLAKNNPPPPRLIFVSQSLIPLNFFNHFKNNLFKPLSTSTHKLCIGVWR